MSRDVILQAEVPVRITHPEKALFPDPPTTKLQYLHYLVQMAPYLLRHLANRRITLVRCPDGPTGNRFYQRHVLPGAPSWLLSIPGEEGKQEIIVPDIATLLYYGNMGAIEFHATLARVGEDLATSLSFDLDPSTPDFEPVREVALRLRDVLSELSIDSVVKTSGATGLQVFVPLQEEIPFHQTKTFVTFIAKYMEQRWPSLVSTARIVRDRGHRVYIDAPQHGHTKTLIATYSVRATNAATVSTPITWDELAKGCLPTDFTIRNVPARVTKLGDLMEDRERTPSSAVIHVLEALNDRAKF